MKGENPGNKERTWGRIVRNRHPKNCGRTNEKPVESSAELQKKPAKNAQQSMKKKPANDQRTKGHAERSPLSTLNTFTTTSREPGQKFITHN